MIPRCAKCDSCLNSELETDEKQETSLDENCNQVIYQTIYQQSCIKSIFNYTVKFRGCLNFEAERCASENQKISLEENCSEVIDHRKLIFKVGYSLNTTSCPTMCTPPAPPRLRPLPHHVHPLQSHHFLPYNVHTPCPTTSTPPASPGPPPPVPPLPALQYPHTLFHHAQVQSKDSESGFTVRI